MTHPDIVRAIQSLVAQGKTPSMALLKARLGGSAPMPVLIQALRQYKQDPAQFQVENAASAPLEPSLSADTAQTPAQGEPTLQQLYDEIRALRAEVSALRAEIKKK